MLFVHNYIYRLRPCCCRHPLSRVSPCCVTDIVNMSVIADFPPVSGAPAFAVSLHDPINLQHDTIPNCMAFHIFKNVLTD